MVEGGRRTRADRQAGKSPSQNSSLVDLRRTGEDEYEMWTTRSKTRRTRADRTIDKQVIHEEMVPLTQVPKPHARPLEYVPDQRDIFEQERMRMMNMGREQQ